MVPSNKEIPYYPSLRWKWSKDFGCYVASSHSSHPDMFGIGNKMLYWQAGVDTDRSVLRSSTSDHWGGWNFGTDLQRGLDWMKEINE